MSEYSRTFLNIDNFKSNIKNGLARPNKFAVEFPSPSSLLAKIDRTQNEQGGLPENLEHIHLMCKACSFPMRQLLTSERLIGMVQQKLSYGFVSQDITFSFYESNKFPMRRYFNTWIACQVDLDSYELNFKKGGGENLLLGNEGYVSDITIIALDNQGNESARVKLIDAFPHIINSVDFANENSGVIDTTVTISYTDFKFENINTLQQHRPDEPRSRDDLTGLGFL